MRLLFGAWLLPAASLIWIGLATTGLRHISDASLALALGRTQATAIVLAVFTALVAASAVVRHQLRRPPATDGSTESRSIELGWLVSHGIAAAIAVAAAAVGLGLDVAASGLVPVAALLGLWAGLAPARAVARCHPDHGGPLVALAAGVAVQLSIGWLHVLHPTGMASPALVVEGLLLAWAAAAAVRLDPFTSPAQDPGPARPAVPVELVTAAGPFSQASAPPSMPEAMAGR